MQIGAIKEGFKLQRIRYLKDVDATLCEFVHEKTSAELIWLKRPEKNKTFAITFKTLPFNNSGLFHIMEHTVLNGSEKYRVREPFVELLKSSVSTFLNAITFSDKTVYPVASRNEKDFFNLMDVYLDAVFNPQVLQDEKIFQQEAWHYAFDQNNQPYCSGVVLNEMKGQYSTLDRQAHNEISRLLFPDNCYSFDSGGDPEEIVKLDYEKFKASHAKFYHPSNARFFLDGDLPLEKVLQKINRGYLANYEKKLLSLDIKEQKPISGQAQHYYELTPNDHLENNCRLSLASIVSSWQDVEKQYALYILTDAIAGSNESVLNQAILKEDLAEDFSIYINDGLAQPWLCVEVNNCNSDNFAKIKIVLKQELEKLIDKGIDKQYIEASLNQLYFRAMEPDEPKGVLWAIECQKSWLYGGDPALYLLPSQHFKNLRDKIKSNYYEKLLEEVFFAGEWVEVQSLPSHTCGEERKLRLQEYIRGKASDWTQKEKESLLKKERELIAWQNKEDSAQALATLPQLKLDDMRNEPKYLATTVKQATLPKVLYHPSLYDHIVYMKYYFDISDLEIDKISQLSLLTDLLSILPTKNCEAKELQRKIKTHVGSLNFSLMPLLDYKNPKRCKLYFVVSSSFLKNELENALSLIEEIIKETSFTDAARAEKQIKQDKEFLRQRLIDSANYFGIMRTAAGFSAQAAAAELGNGLTHIKYLEDFLADFENNWRDFGTWAHSIVKNIFTLERLTISSNFNGEDELISLVENSYPEGKKKNWSSLYAHYSLDLPKKEFVSIPSAVSYACLSSDFSAMIDEFSGKYLAAEQIVALEYLWNKIRVQQGAYGCGFNINTQGQSFFYSSQDPQPKNSIEVFLDTAKFVQTIAQNTVDIERFIIGKIAKLDPSLSYRRQLAVADHWYLSDYTENDQLNLRRELIATEAKDLIAVAAILEKSLEEPRICVLAPEEEKENFADYALIEYQNENSK